MSLRCELADGRIDGSKDQKLLQAGPLRGLFQRAAHELNERSAEIRPTQHMIWHSSNAS